MEKESFNCYLIGDDQLVLGCAEIILSHNHLILGIISSFPAAEEFAAQKKIPYFKKLADAHPVLSITAFDYLFSIVNGVILPVSLLQQPRCLAINYHNGPLPKYAGLHAPSWAILNNENSHGVTWHTMVEEIDAGDILKQAFIEIDPDETGLSLSVKCYQEAINTFKELIYDISGQQLSAVPQNLKHRSYYDYYKKPRHGGWINWHESAESINRLCRALNLGSHHHNRLGLPKFNLGSHFFLVTQARIIDARSDEAPGTLVQINTDYWQVATKKQIIQLEHVIALHHPELTNLAEIAAHYDLTVGTRLPSESERNLLEYEYIDEMYAIHELFWVRQIKRFNPALLPFQSLSQGMAKEYVWESIVRFDASALFSSFGNKYADNSSYFILAALFIYLRRLGNKGRFGVGLSHPKLHQLPVQIAPLFSKIVPFLLSVEEHFTVEQLLAAFFEQIALVDKHLSFTNDVYYRYPELFATLESFYPIVVVLGNENEVKKHLNEFNASVIINISNGYKIQWYSRENNLALHQVIENSVHHLPILLKAMFNHPTQPILKLPVLAPRERERLMVTWNQTQSAYPKNKSVVMLFLEQVHMNPAQIALSYEGVTLSYGELNQKSNQLAHRLQKNGVFVGNHIALCTDQKIDLIIGLIAILKLGAAYIPIDTNYPSKHIQFILSDSSAILVLASESIKHKMQVCCANQDVPLLILDTLIADAVGEITTDLNPVPRNPEDLAYIMYTSGTTGKPKGVMIPHQGINRLVKATNYIQITSEDRIAQAASIGFDAATFEIWGALLNGATLVAVPQEAVLNVMQFSQFLLEKEISILWLTSALFNEYASLNPSMFRRLAYLLVGGDVLNAERIMNVLHCDQGAPKYILNGYGPTENTTFTTCYHITPKPEGYQSIPIGKPIANTTVYVLDKYLQPVPVGAPGELYTGGDGVALGYLNRPEISAAKFIPNLYNHNQGYLYKTGDIVRWMPDGTIDYLGRQDNQIKIRGFRVELEAIYTVLLHHEFISQCTVRIVENERHQKFIAAYIVLSDEAQVVDIQRYMAAHLPQYMIPSFFIKMDKIPLTLNGKVNFDQLPTPNFSLNSLHTEYIAPHTQTEKNVERIWCALFGLDQIGIHDGFFELGGHSLMMTQLVLKIKEQLHYDLSLQQFLENPTISHLAHLIDKNRTSESQTSTLMQHWHFDTELNIISLPKSNQHNEAPKAVLLTGANGFLGSSLLHQLYCLTSATIYCLVRGSNEEEVRAKWERALNYYSPELKDEPRIRLLAGDLEKSYLGLSIEQFMTLAETVDIIYHNGAMVNHLYSYELLRTANVLSVKELLKLATIKKQIPIHYISTLSAASNYTDNADTIIEDFIYTHPNPPPGDGYSQTKWVAEQLLAKAHQQQLPIKIYRPGWILGNSASGIIAPEKNHLLMLIKGCLQLGVAPDWDIALDILPVEYVSQIIVKTSLNKKIPYNIFNLINPNKLAWKDLIAYLTQRGYRLSLCSPKKWRNILAKEATHENALYSLITLYINQNDNDWMDGLKKISVANNQNTLHAFKENNMNFPLIDQNILNTYFNYLEQTGFLDMD